MTGRSRPRCLPLREDQVLRLQSVRFHDPIAPPTESESELRKATLERSDVFLVAEVPFDEQAPEGRSGENACRAGEDLCLDSIDVQFDQYGLRHAVADE